jgi:hypothetical protein
VWRSGQCIREEKKKIRFRIQPGPNPMTVSYNASDEKIAQRYEYPGAL